MLWNIIIMGVLSLVYLALFSYVVVVIQSPDGNPGTAIL